MKNVVLCPHCGEQFEMETDKIPVGKALICPVCGKEFEVEEKGEFFSN
jgi:transcription elongation factor Elf1